MHPLSRVMISLVLSVMVFLILKDTIDSRLMRWTISWDVFALSYCIACWIVFFTRSPRQIKQRATREDGSRVFLILLILVACFASLIMVLMLMLSDDAGSQSKLVYSLSAVLGMMLSWAMVHTTLTFHYAHLYYVEKNAKISGEGLEFPDEKNPDYIDFAYFSFVIGMTFQVSDVEISNRIIRRLTLLHSLISFMLNTFVVALTINLIAGLKK